jgi:hypothetical protein
MPEIMRLVVVALPLIVTDPGNIAVIPDRPIVIPVEDDAPIEIVLELSITTPESPVMLVPLKVRAAVAIDAAAKKMTTLRANPKVPRKRLNHFREFIEEIRY